MAKDAQFYLGQMIAAILFSAAQQAAEADALREQVATLERAITDLTARSQEQAARLAAIGT